MNDGAEHEISSLLHVLIFQPELPALGRRVCVRLCVCVLPEECN